MKKETRNLIIGLLVGILLVGGGITIYNITNNNDSEADAIKVDSSSEKSSSTTVSLDENIDTGEKTVTTYDENGNVIKREPYSEPSSEK